VPDTSPAGSAHGASIELIDLTKQYEGAVEPAVDKVSMSIPPGELVVFVGPSGCGKTTTMKMINRIIEPTSGQILIDGQDAMSLDPVELRRGIGYVIQQIGLFPHMTIGENVAVVPRLLGWDKKRTAARVDELLDIVSLDPSSFRDRYPRQLSGGQQQRVGVARALAADPPVMLMDEPFGATDPITRERLQNEFLRLQNEIRKTIIFVTHDFEEALKMGDRIAVLREQSHIAQFATPDQILANPADEYVSSFVGEGAALKRLGLVSVGAAPLQSWGEDASGLPSIPSDVTLREALGVLVGAGSDRVVVRGPDGPMGVLTMATVTSMLEGAGDGDS
jgi:osmoprotectant transport system ATP-binding protein